jgi:hypothetical protein|tara:strand:+ start:19 stop:207 length:189 start_codon:yes stop_codon:yes gene_type:complete
MTIKYYVEIYEISTGKVANRMEKSSEYGAEKLYNTIVNNQRLNDLYDVRIVEDTVMEEEVYW